MTETILQDVSDTALWVAVYRAEESKRSDALFHDPLADRLAGDRGRMIASRMSRTKMTAWSLVIRTHIIDGYFRDLINQGVDVVVNLGTGLDTRPYRLDLPSSLKWIELDFPQIIRLKEEKLRDEKPRCQLERIAVDLSNDSERRAVLSQINGKGKKIAVLTEGVLPYLTDDQVTALAKDLRQQDHIAFWIADYYSPLIHKHLQTSKRKEEMKNAPFRFLPQDWFGFFANLGWSAREKRYLYDEANKVGRPFPLPWWAKFFSRFMPDEKRQTIRQMSAYVLLEPK